MRRLRHIFCAARHERGGVLLIVALCMPVLIGCTGLVLDVGNWFEHRRHLQTQADAAVLAAAGDFRFPCDVSVNSKIAARVEEYGKTRNPQVGGTDPGNVEFLINSRRWPRQTKASDPVDPTVVEGQPCAARMIDVKMTEHGLPWFLKATGVVDHINVKARVSLFPKTRGARSLPIGVPDVNPKAVRVWFVDETTSPPTDVPGSSKLLKRRLGVDGTPLIENGLAIWDNAAVNAGTPLPLKVERSKLGMRVALSQDASTTDCASTAVKCYDASSGNGLLFVRGHATTPVVNNGDAPQVRDAWLLSGTCGDGYFSMQGEDCDVQLNARIDLAPNVATNKVTVVALAGGKTYAMNRDSADGMWKTGAGIPVASGDSVPIGVQVQQKDGSIGGTACTNPNPCAPTTFNDVQRHMSASSDRSGPIGQLVVSNAAGTGANSLERCTATKTTCTYDLTVRVGLLGSVHVATSAASPPLTLRVAGGSQTGSLDCDPDSEFQGGAGQRLRADLRDQQDERVRPERHRAVQLRAGRDRRQDEPGAGRHEPAHVRRREGEDLHETQPVAGGADRPAAAGVGPASPAHVDHPVRVVPGKRQPEGAGPELRVLLHHRLGRLRRRVHEPVLGPWRRRRLPGGGLHHRPLRQVRLAHQRRQLRRRAVRFRRVDTVCRRTHRLGTKDPTWP